MVTQQYRNNTCDNQLQKECDKHSKTWIFLLAAKLTTISCSLDKEKKKNYRSPFIIFIGSIFYCKPTTKPTKS